MSCDEYMGYSKLFSLMIYGGIEMTKKTMTAVEARAKAEELEIKALENYKKALEKAEKAKAKAEKLEAKEAEEAKAKEKANGLDFEIIQHICDMGTPSEQGWVKQLNVVKWGDNEPKYDIRSWNPEHTKMTKGITLTKHEICEMTKGFIAFVNENK